MTNTLANTIASFSAEAISNLFICLILALLAFSILCRIINKAPRFTDNTANLLTSMGILGTFAGIVVGLMAFDPNNIDGSIEFLLSGLKTAFLTSLVGMSTAILYRIVANLLPEKQMMLTEDVGVEELYQAMQQQVSLTEQINKRIAENKNDAIVEQLKDLQNTQQQHQTQLIEQLDHQFEQQQLTSKQNNQQLLEKMTQDHSANLALAEKQLQLNQIFEQKSLSLLETIEAHHQTSLAEMKQQQALFTQFTAAHQAQFETQQQQSLAFQTQLWEKMAEFAEMLSKSATEQVIQALKDVIVEFNEKLTEQFGDNFKRLDESVQKLLEWQDNYRLQLADMSEKYQLGVQAITATEQSVAHISERAETIPQTMHKLEQVMGLAQDQLTELEQRLEAFKSLRDQAIEAMPQIKAQLDKTMDSISDSVHSANTHYQNMLTQSAENMDSFIGHSKHANELFKRSVEQTSEQLVAGGQALQTEINAMATTLTQHSQTQSQQLTQAALEIQQQLANTSAQLSEGTTEIKQELAKTATQLTDGANQIKQELAQTTTQLTDGANQIKQELAQTTTQLIEGTNTIQQQLNKASQLVAQQQQNMAEQTKITMQNMQQINQELLTQNEQLISHTDALKDNLQSNIKALNQELIGLTTEVKNEAQQAISNLKAVNQTFMAESKAMQEQTANAIETMQQRLEKTLDEILNQQSAAIRRTFENLEGEIAKAVAETDKGVKKQVEILDQQLQQELNRTLTELGSALATVTQTFTKDYQALVNEMAKVINTKMVS